MIVEYLAGRLIFHFFTQNQSDMLQLLAPIYMKTIGQVVPTDWFAPRYPVSVKGICRIDGKIVLLKNERGQWDLPGGKLKKRETIERCLKREMKEELGIAVSNVGVSIAKTVKVLNQVTVLILICECKTDATVEDLSFSYESFGLGLFSDDDALHHASHLLGGLLK